MPPSGFCKAGKLECYPRPVSIWCPPAHKAITMFLADRGRSSIRITAFYGALPLRHAGFFFSPIGNRTREFGLCVLFSAFLCFFCPALKPLHHTVNPAHLAESRGCLMGILSGEPKVPRTPPTMKQLILSSRNLYFFYYDNNIFCK
jgi:hypothetical protein